jgi:hypothetical protein
LQPVNLGRQDEVRLSQSVHRVRPGCDLNLAPSQQNIGMMPLLLGNFSYLDNEARAVENQETCGRAPDGVR